MDHVISRNSSKLPRDYLNHLINILSSFGTDLNILTPIRLGHLIRISYFFIIRLISNQNNGTRPTRLLNFLDPQIHIIHWALITQIHKQQDLTALTIELVSDLCEV